MKRLGGWFISLFCNKKERLPASQSALFAAKVNVQWGLVLESCVPFWTRLARESKAYTALSAPVSLGTEISQIPIDHLRDKISCINKPHVTTIKLLFYYQAL